MKVWIFVEGQSDADGLQDLFSQWKRGLQEHGAGIAIIPFGGKSPLLNKIGARAAEKLMNNGQDLAVGLPDLYPTALYDGTKWEHGDVATLSHLQEQLVAKALRDTYGVRRVNLPAYLDRFHGSALKHDLEMLLLASPDALKMILDTSESLIGRW